MSSPDSIYIVSDFDKIKAECYEANLLLPEYKLIDLTFGNVRVADPERRVFAIKPSGLDYSVMKANDMVVVDFERESSCGRLSTLIRYADSSADIQSVHSHSVGRAHSLAQCGRIRASR